MIKPLPDLFTILFSLALFSGSLNGWSQCTTLNAVATPSSQTICSGSSINPIVLSSNRPGTTFNWTRNNTAAVTGIAAIGSGNISGILTNTTNTPVTVTFTITPQSTQLLNESFNTVLPPGWAQQNLSSPVGTQPSWFAGTAMTPLTPTGYIAVNYNSSTNGNIASNWLFTPEIPIRSGDSIRFTTRASTNNAYIERIQVRLSLNGNSVNAGSNSISVGDFTNLIIDLGTGGTIPYPPTWATVAWWMPSGIPAGTTGRLAFRYFTMIGSATHPPEVGIDDVIYTSVNGVTCTGTPVTATVIVNPSPTVSISSDIPPPIGPGQVMTLTANVSPTGGTFVWRKDGVIIFGATSNILTGITVTETGNYNVTYTDLNGCVTTSSNFNVFARPGEGLFIHPNPNNGDFRVTFYNTTPNEEVSLTVSDPMGRIVLRSKITTGVSPYSKIEVDLKNSNTNGVYLVEARNSKGIRIGSGIVRIAK